MYYTIIIPPKLTSEQQEGSLSDCVSPFPMKMSASPPVLIILEVAISRRRLEATNQAKWQFRVGHGAHGGRGQMGTRSGTGKPMTTHYRSFSKTNLESTLSALLFVTGWRRCNGKSFSWGSEYFSRFSVTSIWCTVQQYIKILQKIWSHPVTCQLVPHQPKRVTAASREREQTPSSALRSADAFSK